MTRSINGPSVDTNAGRILYPTSLTTFPILGQAALSNSMKVLSGLNGDFYLRISAPLNESDRIGAFNFLHFHPDRQGNQNLHVVRHGGGFIPVRNSGCSFFWSQSSLNLKVWRLSWPDKTLRQLRQFLSLSMRVALCGRLKHFPTLKSPPGAKCLLI